MRKKILFISIMLCLFVSGLAKYGLTAWGRWRLGVDANIPLPIVNTVQPAGNTWLGSNDDAELADGQYLLRNVATGKYWGVANKWGTQASLTDNPEYVTLSTLADGTYQMESQVNNGEADYYFNGDFMDNNSPVALTISKHANGYYTIGNGTIYYGYNGENTVMGKTETDPAATNVQWDIISVDAATAALSTATAHAPQNATFLIADANFGRNNRYYNQWTFEASNQDNSGDVTNYCVESWHAEFTMSQTISVPNGVYGLVAQGFYRQDGSDNEHLPVFFLNNETVTFPVRKGVENSMSDASASFSQGLYTITPILAEVTDGTITLGTRLEDNTSLWCIWDNFTLLYYGTEESLAQIQFDVRFDNLVAQAKIWRNTEGITFESKRLLDAAIAAYTAIDANVSESEQQTVETQLNEAIQYANQGISLAEQLKKIYTNYGALLSSADASNSALNTLLQEIAAAINTQVYADNAQIEHWLNDLQSTKQTYFPYEYHYWFDNDDSNVFEGVSNTSAWHIDADISGLSDALHILHLQVKYGEGDWSTPVAHYFVKQGGMADFSYRIWTEDDLNKIFSGSLTNQTIELDVSAMVDGLHTIHAQVTSSLGASIPEDRLFIKIPQTEGVEYLTCLMFIDDQPYCQEKVATSRGVVNWSIDVGDLTLGLHNYMLQVITPSGAATDTKYGFFFRDTKKSEYQALQCYYMVDGDEVISQAGTLADGLYHFDLDVSAFTDGLHHLSYWLADGTGVMTETKSTFFTKVPLGGYGINHYEYWVNEGFDERIQTAVNPRQEKLSLIALLPVSTQPFRSSSFQFAFKNNVPLLYAKNDFHIRFHDASGRFTETTESYVDENVSEAIEPVGELQETQMFDRVAENEIRWYTIALEEGDSVAFKSSQACTMQLLSPTGEEVYNASGSNSVSFDGCHAWEEGTYYLAVHDVTGSQSTMTLNYMHMDKYDVVDWDVHTVGNGGCSTITFKGNGFRDLGSVDLYTAEGDTIHSVDVGHESDAETSVTFDFSGAELSIYDAAFHFADEDKRLSEIVTVEEAVDIELITDVSFPSSFLRGTSTTYTIKLTNNGNMTAYYVPLELKLIVGSIKNVSEIHFDGYINPVKLSDILSTDSLEEETINMIREAERESNDISQFVIYQDSVTNTDYGLSQIILSLPPNSTKTFTVTIKSTATVSLEAYMTKEWFPLTDYKVSANSRRRVLRASKRDWMCCQRERFECAADAIASIAGVFMPPGAGCATSLALTGLETAYDVWCSDGGSASEKWNNYLQSQGQSLANRLIQSAVSCVTAYFHFQKKKLMDDRSLAAQLGSTTEVNRINAEIQALRTMESSAIRNIYNGITTAILGGDCVRAFTQTKPNCPPNPGGGGGSSSPQPPSDPNDIYGYLAESGSKFIADSVEKVNYTIEFENDTTFAMASAHTIAVRDTLDSRYFKLDTFLPTGIKLGGHDVFLSDADVTTKNGNTTFVKTIDVRPEINAIAQVEGAYNSQTGIAEWRFTSLDPMSMEPTDELTQGILPVNTDGTSGIGEVMFEVDVKPNKGDGTEVKNRASIVFDYEEPILTPTWTNIVDAIAPTSHVSACEIKNDTTATLHFEGTDNLSGVWKYDVYVQYEEDASWYKCREGVTGSTCDVRIYEGINHGFYVVATDSAGNVEAKEAAREYTLDLFEPTEDSDLELELAEGWNWISHNLNTSLNVAKVQQNALRILGQEEETMKDATLGFVGDLTELKPTLGYKVQMAADEEISLEGKLFNASYKSIGLVEGWNWIGYPMAHAMEIPQVLSNFTPSEGDCIVGQDGFAQYADGEWVGTLTALTPGLGYLYKSGTTQQMFFNSTATLSSRAETTRRAASLNPWTCDKRKYPNVMAVTAHLYNGRVAEDAADYYVAAFCGNECRGVAQAVKGLAMMNVYGQGNEVINFRVIDKSTEQLMDVAESVTFSADVLGSLSSPYHLTIGDEATNMVDIAENGMRISPAVIRNTMTVTVSAERIDRLTVVSASGSVVANWKKLADGSTVDVSALPAGVYLVKAKTGKEEFTKKVMKVSE